MAKVGRLHRSPSLSSDSNSGKVNKKGYPFYLDTVLNATIPFREEAEKLLKSNHPIQNVVLMRPSAKAGCWALSVQTIIAGNTEFNHYSVVKGAHGFLIDIDRKHRPMTTLSEVIDQFIKMASKESRRYILFDANAKPPSQTPPTGKGSSSSMRNPAGHRTPHSTIPLPATPGPPPAAPRPPATVVPPSKPSIVSQPDYIPIEPDPVTDYLDITGDYGDRVPPATAANGDDYLTVYDDSLSAKQVQCSASGLRDDYLTLSDEPENGTVLTRQLQDLRVDDKDVNDDYLVINADYQPAANAPTSKELNNNKSKIQSNGKQLGPPPTAPRPAARS